MAVLETYARALAAPGAPDDGRLSLHLLDTLGAWIAGLRCEEGRELLDHADAPLFADGALDRIALAVATTRLTEIDDIHIKSCTTCGSVVAPVSLIMAGELGADARRLALALRNGYETMMRFGAAVNGPSILYRGIWPTFLAAPIGAAAATAALLRLDEAQTANALAIALAQTSGAPGGHARGLSSRWLLCGLAARAGVSAALMAARGFGGDATLFDGDWMQRTHGIAFDPALFAEPAPILHETSMKPWCAAKQTIAATDAFRHLLAQGLSPERIAAIRVEVPNAYKAMISGRPPGRLGRIINIGWQIGVAACRPNIALDLDRSPTPDDDRIEALARKVEVVGSEALDALFPAQWPGRVVITLDDGTTREHLVTDATGDPAHPLDRAAVADKFLRVTSAVGEATARRIVDLAARPVEAIDLAALGAALDDALAA